MREKRSWEWVLWTWHPVRYLSRRHAGKGRLRSVLGALAWALKR